jgi:hypothetical protein
MSYRITVDQTRIRRLDKPAITGQITDRAGIAQGLSQLAFCTFGLIKTSTNEPSEAAAEVLATSFRYQYPDPISQLGPALVYVRIFPKVQGLAAVLAAPGIGPADTVLDLTVATGQIPDQGWARIGLEVFGFLKTGPAQITIDTFGRGQYETQPASHTAGDEVAIAAGRITAENTARIDVYDEAIL